MKKSTILFAAVVVLLGACQDTSTERQTPTPKPEQPRLNPLLKYTEVEKQFETHIAAVPGLLDGDIANPCPTQIEFLKGLQAQLFPDLEFRDFRCDDNSSITGYLSHLVHFKVKNEDFEEDFKWTCWQDQADVAWTCGGSSKGTSPLGYNERIALFDWGLLHSTDRFATKEPRGELKFFGRGLSEYVASLSVKARTEGLEYKALRGAKGFGPNDTTLKFELQPEGDGLKGVVVFKEVPQPWFEPWIREPSVIYPLFDCPDLPCLDGIRYEIRGKFLKMNNFSKGSNTILPFVVEAEWLNPVGL